MNQLYTELLPEDPTWDETYPRPQMVRGKWQSLNGEWQMDIGKTCNVPFCLESIMSGVCTTPYGGFTMMRTFTLDDDLQGDLILFHFGAVDEYADVFINGNYLGPHDNGYLPFTYAVPREELVGKENVIRMDIADTTDRKFPYGKQKINRGGIWYTAITGIWQTIWMEAVPKDYIVKIRTITQNDQVQIHKYLSDGTVEVEEKQIKDPHLWNMDDPYLYYDTVSYKDDHVKIYYAFRNVEIRDKKVYLNDSPVFLNGVLDQGYFPDGIFTPATPKEYERDILRIKDLGFNMLRKHVKLEPEIFYYYCDLHGMLVMQDMINNGTYSFLWDTAIPALLPNMAHDDKNQHTDPETRENYLESMKAIIDLLSNHPCVIGYTLFNEGWGQFTSDHIYELAKELDPTRLIDSTSGWFAGKKSDFNSQHLYFPFQKKRMPKIMSNSKLPVFLSEFGGISLKIDGHTYSDKEYGYTKANDEKDLTDKILQVYNELVIPYLDKGLCGCVYTQLTDIEDEINGFYTYDRLICKVDPDRIREMNQKIRY